MPRTTSSPSPGAGRGTSSTRTGPELPGLTTRARMRVGYPANGGTERCGVTGRGRLDHAARVVDPGGVGGGQRLDPGGGCVVHDGAVVPVVLPEADPAV